LDLVVRASTMISSWTSPWLTSRLSACFLHDEDFVFILHGFVLMDQSLTDFQVVGVLLAWGFVCLMHTYSICLQASRGYFWSMHLPVYRSTLTVVSCSASARASARRRPSCLSPPAGPRHHLCLISDGGRE
jgi:hypothetical protein